MFVLVCAVLSATPQSISIDQAVRQAVSQYPGNRAAAEAVSAAAAGVDVARTAYLPRLDFLTQVNRATRNNVFGMLMPQAVIPAISGPPLATNSLESVWGSAAGLLFSWEPFDFGQRSLRVAEAESGRLRAQRAAERTSFETAVRAADLFLTVLAAEQRATAAEASVARSRTLLSVSESLVKAELRPGVDASRSRAEVARAETELLQARRTVDAARAELAVLLNTDASALKLEAPRMVQSLPSSQQAASATHPLLAEQQAAVEQARAARVASERAWYPRFNLQAASYARGTGAVADGRTLGGVNGLGPNIHNWGLGFTATFPTLDFASVRARARIETYRERAEVARLDQFKQDLGAVVGAARVELDSAFAVARQTPIQLESARAAERQASARYKAGLASIVDLADAQRLVTQAEIDDALARLTAWRALLRLAAAQGDLGNFLKEAAQ